MQNNFQAQLETQLKQQEAFLLFREPQSTCIELWIDEAVESENKFVFHSFDGQTHLEFNTPKVEQIPVEELHSSVALDLPFSTMTEGLDEASYLQLIRATVEELKTTSTQKIVISRIKEIENRGVNWLKTLKHLHQHYPNAYVYAWFTPEHGLWIGASPELLLEEENLTIQTVSLAGTLPKDEEWTSKEIHEQQVVTDYIVSQLTTGQQVHVDGPHTVDAGFFNHLKSYISTEVSTYAEVEETLIRLHPTPAVCGMPKARAQAFIAEKEGYNRKFYAGYMGYKKPNKSLYFVNLRCAQLFRNVVKLYVGGGIMPDSIPEKEWKETELKSKTIGNLLVTD